MMCKPSRQLPRQLGIDGQAGWALSNGQGGSRSLQVVKPADGCWRAVNAELRYQAQLPRFCSSIWCGDLAGAQRLGSRAAVQVGCIWLDEGGWQGLPDRQDAAAAGTMRVILAEACSHQACPAACR